MTKILLVQGANLTFLGRREPAIYGTTTAAELDALLQSHATRHGYALDIFYSNIEGEAINRIYQAVDEGFDGLVMNPAGFTYAGFALKDCVKGAGLPYVEVHISILQSAAFTASCRMHPRASSPALECTLTSSVWTRCWRSCEHGGRNAVLTGRDYARRPMAAENT
jgi:3-dehydroquinate dehydratase II